MKLEASGALPTAARGDVLVVGRFAGDTRAGAESAGVDRALGGFLARVLAEERFEGRVGETTSVHTEGRLGVGRVVVVGLGPRAEASAETLRRAASAGVRRARDLGARRVVMALPGPRLPPRARAQALGEGACLGLYAFDRYKAKRPEPKAVETVTVLALSARS